MFILLAVAAAVFTPGGVARYAVPALALHGRGAVVSGGSCGPGPASQGKRSEAGRPDIAGSTSKRIGHHQDFLRGRRRIAYSRRANRRESIRHRDQDHSSVAGLQPDRMRNCWPRRCAGRPCGSGSNCRRRARPLLWPLKSTRGEKNRSYGHEIEHTIALRRCPSFYSRRPRWHSARPRNFRDGLWMPPRHWSGRPPSPSSTRIPASGTKRRRTKSGLYTVPLLPPGTYRVTAEKPGFREVTRSGLKLDVDQKSEAGLRSPGGIGHRIDQRGLQRPSSGPGDIRARTGDREQAHRRASPQRP